MNIETPPLSGSRNFSVAQDRRLIPPGIVCLTILQCSTTKWYEIFPGDASRSTPCTNLLTLVLDFVAREAAQRGCERL